MQAAMRFAIFVLLFAASERVVRVSSQGASVAECDDLTPRHGGTPAMDCGSECPFSVSVVAIDGVTVSGSATYKCGSLHTREWT